MPAYQAERTLPVTVDRLPPHLREHVLVCDDGSGDRTSEVARELRLELITHRRNRGYGAAQKSLYARALERGVSAVVMLHPDNQYDAEQVPAAAAPVLAGEVDYVLGSRLLDGRARERGMPGWKWLANRFLTGLQNVSFGTAWTDLHTGLRVYSRQVLQTVPWAMLPDGFGFDCEMLLHLHGRGLQGREVPVGCSYRVEGASSVGLREGAMYGIEVLSGLLRYQLGNGSYRPSPGGSSPPAD